MRTESGARHLGQELNSVHARHLEIRYNHTEGAVFAEHRQTFQRTQGRMHVEYFAELPAEAIENLWIVVDE
jgi:hypothetical protein